MKGRVPLFQPCLSGYIPEGIIRYMYNPFPTNFARFTRNLGLLYCCLALALTALVNTKTGLSRSKAAEWAMFTPCNRKTYQSEGGSTLETIFWWTTWLVKLGSCIRWVRRAKRTTFPRSVVVKWKFVWQMQNFQKLSYPTHFLYGILCYRILSDSRIAEAMLSNSLTLWVS